MLKGNVSSLLYFSSIISGNPFADSQLQSTNHMNLRVQMNVNVDFHILWNVYGQNVLPLCSLLPL